MEARWKRPGATETFGMQAALRGTKIPLKAILFISLRSVISVLFINK